jgi:hypothetical protein
MNEPARAAAPEPVTDEEIEREVDEAIALCGGDVRAALRATLIANSFLDARCTLLGQAISTGFSRGKIRRRPKPKRHRKKARAPQETWRTST